MLICLSAKKGRLISSKKSHLFFIRLRQIVLWSLFSLAGIFALTVLSLRYGVLPNIDNYREKIAHSVTRAVGQKVTIARISANWERARPHLKLSGMQIYDAKNRPALFLADTEATLSWTSLLHWDLRLRTFVVNRPVLSVRREADGLIYLAGAAINGPPGEATFGDWLLRQPEIIVQDAVIEWQDELRQAPLLNLQKVNFRLLNRGERHRFGLTASPPLALARPLDFRGELYGKSLSDFSLWRGELFAALDQADLNRWGQWLPYPFEIKKGQGGVRLWLGFKSNAINHVAANVSLINTDVRLRPELPLLEIDKLNGILAWRDLSPGFQVQVQQLMLVAKQVNLPSSNIQLRYQPSNSKALSSGEIKTAALTLAPLITLVNYLPVGGEAAQALAQLAFQGRITDFSASWQGDWRAPQNFSLAGKFENFGFRKYRAWPGVTGLSGHVEATEKSGNLALNALNVRVETPETMAEPILLSTLSGRVTWTGMGPQLKIKIPQLKFSNAHMAGQANGSYSALPKTMGNIDLTAMLTRADARYVWQYLPLMIHNDVRHWIKTAFVSGVSNDVKLRVKGNLSALPFADKKTGLFEMRAKFNNGILVYDPAWPRAENLAGEVLLENKKMDVRLAQGRISNMKLVGVEAAIPDLLHGEEILNIAGEAHGASNDMLRFIDASPVSSWLHGVTKNMTASGQGKLLLKLAIPMRHPERHKVNGSYQLTDNRIEETKQSWPLLEHTNGVLTFSESQLSGKDIHAQALGGTVRMNIQSQGDVVQISLAGIADAQQVSQVYAPDLSRFVQGKASWVGNVVAHQKDVTLKIDSDLMGVSVTLPQPLLKTSQESVPTHWESNPAPNDNRAVKFNYGNRLFGQLVQTANSSIERGSLRFGAAPSTAESPGIWISGETPYLDLDAWQRVFKGGPTATPTAKAERERAGVSGVDVAVNIVDIFERRINNVKLDAKLKDEIWSANIMARELSGALTWQPQGRGKITAKLKTFTFPEADGTKSVSTGGPAALAADMPVLEITSENIIYNKKQLGALEIVAVPKSREWQIEKFKLANADGVVQGSGTWQDWQPQSLTKIDVLIEAEDLGKFLARWGHPDRLAKGSAKVSGQLSWVGDPASLDFPSLSGSLKLEAKNGRFLKIEPGIGKLIGILSLQALPRRISLDFRDVFSEGFSFDSISASVGIQRGVASSNDFKMQGPAAKIAMRGEADLAKETQNLRVKVTPLLAESVAMAGTLIGGPVVGLAAYVVQKALQNPFDQIAAYEYGVTGTWEDPKVVKIPRSAEPVAPTP